MDLITSQGQYAANYYERCLASDGYIVMKSEHPFLMGQIFGRSASPVFGCVHIRMAVVGVSTASEAKVQAKKIGGVDIGPLDMRARYYYRVAPESRNWKAGSANFDLEFLEFIRKT